MCFAVMKIEPLFFFSLFSFLSSRRPVLSLSFVCSCSYHRRLTLAFESLCLPPSPGVVPIQVRRSNSSSSIGSIGSSGTVGCTHSLTRHLRAIRDACCFSVLLTHSLTHSPLVSPFVGSARVQPADDEALASAAAAASASARQRRGERRALSYASAADATQRALSEEACVAHVCSCDTRCLSAESTRRRLQLASAFAPPA